MSQFFNATHKVAKKGAGLPIGLLLMKIGAVKAKKGQAGIKFQRKDNKKYKVLQVSDVNSLLEDLV